MKDLFASHEHIIECQKIKGPKKEMEDEQLVRSSKERERDKRSKKKSFLLILMSLKLNFVIVHFIILP